MPSISEIAKKRLARLKKAGKSESSRNIEIRQEAEEVGGVTRGPRSTSTPTTSGRAVRKRKTKPRARKHPLEI